MLERRNTPDHAENVIRRTAALLILLLFFFLFLPTAFARVLMDDTIAVKGEKFMLRAETTGMLFREGGKLVEFFLDDESLGKTLSGGDGVAFKPFVPMKAGLYRLKAISNGGEAAGFLLSLTKGSAIVFVDVEGSLLEGKLSRKPKPGSLKALEEINRKFPVVFLQRGLINVRITKGWLRENRYPDLPVVSWNEGKIFDEIDEKGLKVKAVIGDSSVIDSARKHQALFLSFQPVDNAEWVGDWEEIREKIE